eukprot:TRINITY_DN9514_c0_g2_i15.p2 TRINITY_DN9514_c0_g2~~TRINITY_DN9514_c0_g2_i15.p2  ORF type:complete len:137 (+),score=18.55 TRINITY_DN9514_c0_g2_i15:542-952(+)
MLLYLILRRPFNTTLSNNLNLLSELIILLSFISALFMNIFEVPTEVAEIWGWALIALILAFLIAIWVLLIPSAITDAVKGIKKLFEKKAEENIEVKKLRMFHSVQENIGTDIENKDSDSKSGCTMLTQHKDKTPLS